MYYNTLDCNLGLHIYYCTWMYTKWPALAEVCTLLTASSSWRFRDVDTDTLIHAELDLAKTEQRFYIFFGDR